MQFEWDEDTGRLIGWHGVEPYEVEEIFFKPSGVPTEQTTGDEVRFRFEGLTDAGRLLVVVYTVKGSIIRLVTAFAP